MQIHTNAGSETIIHEAAVPDAPILLSVREAAAALGISKNHVFALLQRRVLRSVRIGRRRLIPRSELHDFISRSMDGAAGGECDVTKQAP